MKSLVFAVMLIFTAWSQGLAGEADVLEVKCVKTGESSFQIWVTVQHDDEGWEHYADKWDVLDMEGNLLDTRVLLHPHSAEPFTRSIPQVEIPAEIKKIRVRAHDSVHGYGGKEMIVKVPWK